MAEEKKDDLLSKGAIVQRDFETYAIAPHLPGGICTPDQLRKLADIAEKYGAKAIKATSAQRLALVGIQEEDIDKIWAELDMPPGHAIGLCVRSVKICPGTTFCRRGQQDAVGFGWSWTSCITGMNYLLNSRLASLDAGIPVRNRG